MFICEIISLFGELYNFQFILQINDVFLQFPMNIFFLFIHFIFSSQFYLIIKFTVNNLKILILLNGQINKCNYNILLYVITIFDIKL